MEYLEKYAEPEVRLASSLKNLVGSARWAQAVVLPLSGEPEAMETLASIAVAAERHRDPTVAILVVNARATHPMPTHSANAALLSDLRTRASASLDSPSPTELIPFSKFLDLIVIDRSVPGFFFPEDQGVGLARKIGCDVGVALWHLHVWDGEILHTTDGDATIAHDYFRAPPTPFRQGIGGSRPSGFLHTYEHLFLGDKDSLALCLYEISLRYYVRGLHFAGSPYAFQTVGSAIAFTPEAYAAVRGFPRRDAAEDFYLMNKLAKVGSIGHLPGKLTLKARPSTRVPFGTGASMRKIVALLQSGGTYPLYDPETFEALRITLAVLRKFAEHRDLEMAKIDLHRHHCGLVAILDGLGAFRAMEIAKQTRPTLIGLERHLLTWFDAFRHLKFVHAVRDTLYPKVNFEDALDSASFLTLPTTRDPYELLQWLRSQEEVWVMQSALSDGNHSGYNELTDAAYKAP